MVNERTAPLSKNLPSVEADARAWCEQILTSYYIIGLHQCDRKDYGEGTFGFGRLHIKNVKKMLKNKNKNKNK